MTPYRWVLALLLIFGSRAVAPAQVIVVPSTPETGSQDIVLSSNARTYLNYYHQSNFASIAGPVLITGMQFRMSATNNGTLPPTWPSQILSYANYDVQLSQPSSAVNSAGGIPVPGNAAFSSYQGAGLTTVRAGSLTIAPAGFNNTGSSTTNAFGTLLSYSTPYLYTPGQGLILYITHTGYTPASEPLADFASPDPAFGVTTAVASGVGQGYQTPIAQGFVGPIIVQFTFVPVPEPGSLALCGVAVGGALIRWRRRRAVV